MIGKEPNYYQILNISSSSSVNEVKKAYRFLALQYHPDVTGNNDLKAEQFRLIKEAYTILSNPEKRKVYDIRNSALNKPSKEISIGSISGEIQKLQSYLNNTPSARLNYDNIHFELENILNNKAKDYLSKCTDVGGVGKLILELNSIANHLPYKLMLSHHAIFIKLTNNTIIALALQQSLETKRKQMIWGWLKFVLAILLAIAICVFIAFML